mmetsp:Transcript_22613/g.26092  ORF Transcript_22613/g.26092 Transcript_22613/m.26092 type:complete len:210 (+) Transcript_22613:129-758(+)
MIYLHQFIIVSFLRVCTSRSIAEGSFPQIQQHQDLLEVTEHETNIEQTNHNSQQQKQQQWKERLTSITEPKLIDMTIQNDPRNHHMNSFHTIETKKAEKTTFSDSNFAMDQLSRSNGSDAVGGNNVNQIDPRIVGGHRTPSFNRYPYMVAVYSQTVVDGKSVLYYTCGGTLIAPNIVLTASHCNARDDQPPTLVQIGRRDRYDPTKNYE